MKRAGFEAPKRLNGPLVGLAAAVVLVVTVALFWWLGRAGLAEENTLSLEPESQDVTIDTAEELTTRKQAPAEAPEQPAAESRFNLPEGFVPERAPEAPEVPTGEDRTPHPAPKAGEVRPYRIEELGNFIYDEDERGLPADVVALDGSGVRVSGYMVPTNQTDQIREFTLVPDLYECCFGEPPGLEHTIHVVLPDGKAVPYTYGQVEVSGTLQVEEETRDGWVINIFTIDDVTSVKTTGK